jgi:hypothetical protein
MQAVMHTWTPGLPLRFEVIVFLSSSSSTVLTGGCAMDIRTADAKHSLAFSKPVNRGGHLVCC